MPSTILESQYILVPKDTTANRPASPSVGMLRYNTTTDGAEVYTSVGWGGFGSPLGTSGNPATSGAQLYNDQPAAPSGLYWFKNSSGLLMQTWVDMAAGGWVLVSSNNCSSTLFPLGTSRNSDNYWIGRAGGSLGTPSPDSDWIIGNWLDTFSFTEVRVYGFGYGSTNNTYTWSNKGQWMSATWSVSSSGTSRYTEVKPRSSVTFAQGGGNSGVSSSAGYFVMDGVRTDSINGGYGADANQSTIGGVGVAASSGDPQNGCYMGWGSPESSSYGEGWYDNSGQTLGCQGYTTWVR